nr:UvrD-helicase domain-containing protein [Thiocapsa sp.]
MAERAHLEHVKQRLQSALAQIDARVRRYADEIKEQKAYLWESRAEMDHAEKVSTRQAVNERVLTGEAILANKKRLAKLLRSPYFGRFDFSAQDSDTPLTAYIGIHSFFDEEDKAHVVFDWRAPIASLFYDYEIGAARYEAPSGEIRGEILLKRQYRIRDGAMEFMIESGLNIVDDVLQKELSGTSDNRMKNIVATIQRDQNAIIRNADAPTLIIQGVAGSGKTSIALHRIAYLLYRFKDTLTSKDILILSPNRVFSDYIANVLPELGEEQIDEIDMETLVGELLEGRYTFETFFEQTARLLEKDDPALQERIREKASLDFLKQLDRYVAHLEATRLTSEDLWIGKRLVPAWFIAESFEQQRALPPTERLKRIAYLIEKKIGLHYNYDITPAERAEIKRALKGMYRETTLRNAYKAFFTWIGRPELFAPAKGSRLEYADVFPLIHLKRRLEGLPNRFKDIKHLLIDEMQDYTPVQYAVLAALFACKKTILGDASQSVNPFGASSAETIRAVLRQGQCAKLNTSYRSSYPIARFAQRVLPNPELVAIERDGEPPRVVALRNRREEIAHLAGALKEFEQSTHLTLGVICKTQRQAARLHQALTETGQAATLLDAASRTFPRGTVVCTAHTAKGLEFDRVIVPEASAANYAREIDRHMLYIACTRAMHHLTLTHVGDPTPWIAAPQPTRIDR